MPDFIREAPKIKSSLLAAYRSRPRHQQNDCLGWINRAKRTETKLRRLDLMLGELKRGDVYMKMAYKPRSPDG